LLVKKITKLNLPLFCTADRLGKRLYYRSVFYF
jgi:hypothetical protein